MYVGSWDLNLRDASLSFSNFDTVIHLATWYNASYGTPVYECTSP